MLILTLVGACALPLGPVFAQQMESPVACDEGNEPLAFAYGDHGINCEIGSAIDFDRFVFDGVVGDIVRFNVISTTTHLDPLLEVRDVNNVVVLTESCFNFFCTMSPELELDETGTYLVTISDVNNDESGGYGFQLERILPADNVVRLDYDATVSDAISPTTDIDRFFFYATPGTTVRLVGLSTTTHLDPTVQVYDPNGSLVINGAADGAQCFNFFCSFAVEFQPALSGEYSLLIFDNVVDEGGDYQLGLWCITGACDSNGPEPPNPNPPPPAIAYDAPMTDVIGPETDSDPYTFEAVAGTTVRLNVLSTTTHLDPTVEVRDPADVLVLNGAADGAQCFNFFCSFSVEFSPAVSGVYSVLFYDAFTDEGGGYEFSLWCIDGVCDSEAAAPRLISHVTTVDDTISHATDADFLTFNATAGTTLRISALSTTTHLDPTLEVRDPNGTLVLNGGADGVQCFNFFCSFTVEFSPTLTGAYSVIVYDSNTDEGGGYQIGLWCVAGDCDSDADGLLDGDRQVLAYDEITTSDINTEIDADYYLFQGTPGDEIRIIGRSTSTHLDPTLELRDPNGNLVLNGGADGAQCFNFGCTFSIDLMPAVAGTYSAIVYDAGTDEAGAYELSIVCLFGTGPGFTCNDLAPPLDCEDNCSNVANVDQRDTNADGFGNLCDPDLDNDNEVNFSDVGIMKSVIFGADEDADLNGDGAVNFFDLGILKALAFVGPGPSCNRPNAP